MEAVFPIMGLFGVLVSLGAPILMIVGFVLVYQSLKRQEAILTEIANELKKNNSNTMY